VIARQAVIGDVLDLQAIVLDHAEGLGGQGVRVCGRPPISFSSVARVWTLRASA
jgi:hypothetical protein